MENLEEKVKTIRKGIKSGVRVLYKSIANPETGASRFALAKFEAANYANKKTCKIGIFKNSEGTFIIRELKFIEPGIKILFTAQPNKQKP